MIGGQLTKGNGNTSTGTLFTGSSRYQHRVNPRARFVTRARASAFGSGHAINPPGWGRLRPEPQNPASLATVKPYAQSLLPPGSGRHSGPSAAPFAPAASSDPPPAKRSSHSAHPLGRLLA